MNSIQNAQQNNNNNCQQFNKTNALARSLIGNVEYNSLHKQFRPDKLRGRWIWVEDFYFACTIHSFGCRIFSELPVYTILFGGVYTIPFYVLGMIFYAIPIYAIHIYLGQFSASGAISAFRLMPIFKGMGYAIVFHTFISLVCSTVMSALPVIYAIHSIYQVMPWMHCNNTWNTNNCSVHSYYEEENIEQDPHATVEYFRYIIGENAADTQQSPWAISWYLLIAVAVLSLLTFSILQMEISYIGRLLRYCCILVLSLFLIIFLCLMRHLEVDWETFLSLFRPTISNNTRTIIAGIRAAIILPVWLFGSGYGSILSLASHNRFHCNSEKYIYWISCTHMLVTLMSVICGRLALDRFEDQVGLLHYHVEEEHHLQFVYLCYTYLFASLNTHSNLYSLLFFIVISLAEICSMIIQSKTILTAITDEFPGIRKQKFLTSTILMGLTLVLAIFFCTKRGFQYMHSIPDLMTLSHLIISLLMVAIIWIYGGDRLQNDLHFMLGKTVSKVKIFPILYITPIFLGISILQVICLLNKENPPIILTTITQSFLGIFIAIYFIYKFIQSTDSRVQFLQKSFQPQPWHSIDADDQHFHENFNTETSEMLVILNNDQL